MTCVRIPHWHFFVDTEENNGEL